MFKKIRREFYLSKTISNTIFNLLKALKVKVDKNGLEGAFNGC